MAIVSAFILLLTGCSDAANQDSKEGSTQSQTAEHIIEEPEAVDEDGHPTGQSLPADDEPEPAEHLDTGTTTQVQAAHVHGEAVLQVVAEGGNIEVRLESPAESIIGFEHPPRDSADWQQAADAIATLSKSDVLVVNDSQSPCASIQMTWSTALFTAEELKKQPASSNEHEGEHHGHNDHADSHDQHSEPDEHEGDADHSSIEASWVFRCKAQPSSLEHQLMVVFPGLKKLEVQLATQGAQTSWATEDRGPALFSLQGD